MQFEFQKLPRSLLDTPKSHRLFQLTATAILDQAVSATEIVDTTRLSSMPPSAQAVSWLWLFSCEAGVCGMDVFILNSMGVHAPEIYAALQTVGASELVHLTGVAVALARNGSAEFKLAADQSWFDQFPLTTEFDELDMLNQPAFQLIRALSDSVAVYIRSHEGELFEPHRAEKPAI